MDIVMAFDDGYITPAIVSIYTLFLHNRDVNLRIICTSLSTKSRMILKKLESDENNNKISFYDISSDMTSRIKVTTGRWREECFYRYFSYELFADIDKCIWLDSDILVRGSLEELFKVDIGDNAYAAVKDMTSKPDERLGISDYYNSGVLVMNLKLLRNSTQMQVYWQLIASDDYRGELPDQDALNIVFANNILEISDIWNTFPIILQGADYSIQNSRLVHFISGKKPWNIEDESYFIENFEHFRSLEVFVSEYWKAFGEAVDRISNIGGI